MSSSSVHSSASKPAVSDVLAELPFRAAARQVLGRYRHRFKFRSPPRQLLRHDSGIGINVDSGSDSQRLADDLRRPKASCVSADPAPPQRRSFRRSRCPVRRLSAATTSPLPVKRSVCLASTTAIIASRRRSAPIGPPFLGQFGSGERHVCRVILELGLDRSSRAKASAVAPRCR